MLNLPQRSRALSLPIRAGALAARKHIVDASHQIQTSHPEVVIAAIREALTLTLAPARLQASSDSGK
jgi:pimeloyl-ACP methyl ester carboxylesterase